jgi:branched-chain amino acid aminotransferase
MLDTTNDLVIYGPTWSFFWVAGGRLLTPPLEDRILASITRAYVLEECDAEERPCTMDDIAGAEEAFIASTVRVVMPIAAVDDIALPAAPGPVTLDARERMGRRIERELAGSAV